MVKQALRCVLIVVVALAWFHPAASYSTVQDKTTIRKKVVFEKGRTSTVIKQTIRRGTNHQYLLRARAGQTMIVHLAAKQCGVTVYTPNEGPAIDEADGVTDWEGALPETGEYTIEVATDARTTAYTLEITIR